MFKMKAVSLLVLAYTLFSGGSVSQITDEDFYGQSPPVYPSREWEDKPNPYLPSSPLGLTYLYAAHPHHHGSLQNSQRADLIALIRGASKHMAKALLASGGRRPTLPPRLSRAR